MNKFDDPHRPLPALTLTIKTTGAPDVHLMYEPGRPLPQSTVTVLDLGSATEAWSFEDVVKDGCAFLVLYVAHQDRWPAELRAPCAGRTRPEEPS